MDAAAAAAAEAAAGTRHSGNECKARAIMARADGEQRHAATAARLEAWEPDGVEAGGGDRRKGAMPPSQLLEEDGPMRWRRHNSGSAAIRQRPDA